MVAASRATRGDIVWVDFGSARGSEQAGRRPALVVQNDVGNAFAPTTVVVAVTARGSRRSYPFEVVLPSDLMPKPSKIRCQQILSVDQWFLLGSPVARLPPGFMAQVDEALRLSLSL